MNLSSNSLPDTSLASLSMEETGYYYIPEQNTSACFEPYPYPARISFSENIIGWLVFLQNTNYYDLTSTTIKTDPGARYISKQEKAIKSGFYNGTYDLTAAMPLKISFKTKARIIKASNFKPQPSV